MELVSLHSNVSSSPTSRLLLLATQSARAQIVVAVGVMTKNSIIGDCFSHTVVPSNHTSIHTGGMGHWPMAPTGRKAVRPGGATCREICTWLVAAGLCVRVAVLEAVGELSGHVAMRQNRHNGHTVAVWKALIALVGWCHAHQGSDDTGQVHGLHFVKFEVIAAAFRLGGWSVIGNRFDRRWRAYFQNIWAAFEIEAFITPCRFHKSRVQVQVRPWVYTASLFHSDLIGYLLSVPAIFSIALSLSRNGSSGGTDSWLGCPGLIFIRENSKLHHYKSLISVLFISIAVTPYSEKVSTWSEYCLAYDHMYMAHVTRLKSLSGHRSGTYFLSLPSEQIDYYRSETIF